LGGKILQVTNVGSNPAARVKKEGIQYAYPLEWAGTYAWMDF
jgi:hypothetical protein